LIHVLKGVRFRLISEVLNHSVTKQSCTFTKYLSLFGMSNVRKDSHAAALQRVCGVIAGKRNGRPFEPKESSQMAPVLL
jgi:hypothetical protein